MKKLVSILLGCFFLISMTGIAQAEETGHSHTDGCFTSGAAMVVVDANGNDVFTIISEDDDLDALHQQARQLLGAGLEPTAIAPRGVVCCIPNPPTNQYLVYTHIPTTGSICFGYQTNYWVCQLCGADVRQTGPSFVNEHIKGTSLYCPYK